MYASVWTRPTQNFDYRRWSMVSGQETTEPDFGVDGVEGRPQDL